MAAQPLTSRGLRAFPAEIREQIYLLAGVWEGKTPNIIKVLRPDKELYDEAMHVFCLSNTYILSRPANGWSFEAMSKETLARIQNLEIVICNNVFMHLPKFEWGFKRLAEQRTPLSSLRHVTFRDNPDPTLRNWSEGEWEDYLHDSIRIILGAIYQDSKDLRSITWITKAAAASTVEVFLGNMELPIQAQPPMMVQPPMVAQPRLQRVTTTKEMTWRWEGEPLVGPGMSREELLEGHFLFNHGYPY